MNLNQTKEEINKPVDSYDIFVPFESLLQLKSGYEVKYSQRGYALYQKFKHQKCFTIGVLGNKSKGKTYLLEKLSGMPLSNTFKKPTKGFGVIYDQDLNIAFIDTPGLDSPAYKNTNPDLDLDMSISSRDKQLTELFIQQFMIMNSNILIVVVGELRLSDQKMLNQIIQKWKTSQRNKLYVVHNLMNYETIKQIEQYIDEELLQHFIDLDKTDFIHLDSKIVLEMKSFYYNQYINSNEDNSIPHLFFGKDNAEEVKGIQKDTINFFQTQIKSFNRFFYFPFFEIIMKNLVTIGKDLFEDPVLNDNDIETIDDKLIKLRQPRDIVLKQLMVDELGFPKLSSNHFSPRYSCIKTKTHFIIEIEIGDKITFDKCKVCLENNMCLFIIKGNKNRGKKESEIESEVFYQTIESGQFSLEIEIPLDDLALASNKYILQRKKSKTNNVLILFPIQEIQKVEYCNEC